MSDDKIKMYKVVIDGILPARTVQEALMRVGVHLVGASVGNNEHNPLVEGTVVFEEIEHDS